jgi:pimeloyl-ACP methyl ester carboxylesterase
MLSPKEFTLELPHLKIQALAYGDAAKPPILALHGWLDNAASFNELAPLLTDYYVVAVDMPGQGLSEHLPKGQHYQFLAGVEHIVQMLDAVGWEQTILMGHSLGGALASCVAASFSERVKKLILIDSLGPISEESTAAPGRLRDAVNMFLTAEKMQRKVYASQKKMIAMRAKINAVPAEKIANLVERASKAVEHGYMWRYDSALSLPSLSYFTEDQVQAFLAAIKAPTLLIEAEEGILSDHDLLQQRKAKIVELREVSVAGGHHVHLTAAVEVAEIIQAFLAK